MDKSLNYRSYEYARETNSLPLRLAPRRIFIFLFAAILFLEGLYLPLLFRLGAGSTVVSALLYLKYAIALGLCLLFGISVVTQRIRLQTFELLGLMSAVLLGTVSVTHLLRQDSGAASAYTVYIFPIIVYFAGRALRLSEAMIRHVLVWITRLWVLVAAYAVIDVFVFGPQLWRDFLQQGTYLIEIKNYTGGIIGGLIGNFYFDPWGLALRRAVGTQGDPLAFAYAAVVPLAALMFLPKSFGRFRPLFIAIGLLALLLSLTRAIMLSLLMVLVIRWVFKRSFAAWALFGAFGASIFVLLYGDSLRTMLVEALGRVDSSTSSHFESFGRLLEVPWFHFIVGNAWISGDPLHSIEASFFEIVVNFGILTTTLLYAFIFRMLWRLNRSHGAVGKALAVTGTVGVVTSFVFSQSFFSFTGFGLFWLLAGAVVSSGTLTEKN